MAITASGQYGLMLEKIAEGKKLFERTDAIAQTFSAGPDPIPTPKTSREMIEEAKANVQADNA